MTDTYYYALDNSAVTAVGAVVAAMLAAIATAFAAVQGRRAQMASIDVRVVNFLKDSVIQLESRVSDLRRDLYESQNETDEERQRRRKLEMSVEDLHADIQRLLLALNAAGIPIPSGVFIQSNTLQAGRRAPKPPPPSPPTGPPQIEDSP